MVKKVIILAILFLALLITPVLADVGYGDAGDIAFPHNVTRYENIYIRTSYAVPFEIWVLIFSAGLIFIGLSIYFATLCKCPSPDAVIISAVISFILFIVASFIVPLMAKIDSFAYLGMKNFSYVPDGMQNPINAVNATNVVITVVNRVGQDWLMWLCWIMAGVSVLVIAYGIQRRAEILSQMKSAMPEEDKEFL